VTAFRPRGTMRTASSLFLTLVLISAAAGVEGVAPPQGAPARIKLGVH
jgi:hypothetical protein